MTFGEVAQGLSFTIVGFLIGIALNDVAKDAKDQTIDWYNNCGEKREAVSSGWQEEDFANVEVTLRDIIENCSRPSSAIAATELAELYCWGFVTSESPKRDYQKLLRMARDGTGVPLFDVIWTMEICKAQGWLDPS